MLTVLDLFSGIGGFTVGLEQTGGFKTIAFCEIEKKCQRVLNKHWPTVPVYEDIRALPLSELAGVDVLTGGFPCQDISIGSNTKKGLDGERSGLWEYYRQCIAELRPRFAIVENVFALRGRGLDRILGELASLGYDAAWSELDSQYFGVPQRRRRIYIVAARDGIPAEADLFQLAERSGPDTADRLKTYARELQDDCASLAEGGGQGVAFFTRQRTDEFAVRGLSSTITKRDYKSFTDVVLHSDGTLRRVMPHERLRLQGMPDTHFDGLGLSNADQFRMNGMTAPVVRYIGERILHELV
jgi:site-specific DNA-cytosine methylase